MRLLRILALILAAACARSGPPRDSLAAAEHRPTAALDTATARRLCAAPDSGTLSVLAGRAGCELRDQKLPPSVLPGYPPAPPR